MKTKKELTELVERIKAEVRHMSLIADPSRDIDRDWREDREDWSRRGWNITKDRFNRDQVEFIAAYFDAPEEILLNMPYADFDFLREKWHTHASEADIKEFYSYEDGIDQQECEDDVTTRMAARMKRLNELCRTHSVHEALEIISRESDEAKLLKRQQDKAPGMNPGDPE